MTDTAAARKARGAFFTPGELADFVAQWAVRSPEDRVLEPSCGEAAFLLSAGERLRTLGAESLQEEQLQGVEIHEASARNAAALVEGCGLNARIRTGDFFDAAPSEPVDAVLGNPPYVRYQQFSGEVRAKAQQIALRQGVRLTGLAGSWAAFVIHASSFLKPQGRLGLVLPAELLTVNYAAPVREFLMKRFAKVRIVLFENLVFPGVLEEIILLLAEGTGPTDHCELYQARDLSSLQTLSWRSWVPESPEQKWIQGLLPPEAANLYTKLRSGPAFSELLDWGETDLGIVTGNNRYFTLDSSMVKALKLPPGELLDISPPSSRHLRRLEFSKADWMEMRDQGARTYLFYPDADKPSPAARRYIAAGERDNVQAAYKCRVRSPWWRVPILPVADLFLTYMNHDTPRLVANLAGVRHLNSVHGVALKKGLKRLGTRVLPLGMLNSLTLLGAELVGRSYGGGILKLEPREADKLPVPSPETLRKVSSKLASLRSQSGSSFRNGELLEVVERVDRIVLAEHLGLRAKDLRSLRQARQALFERRARRGEEKV
ncbi:MAG TPA: N-6 DNA methylase [Thermoanaerobaculia bacterium]|nr:N-6 DNA methylase [Thermoanaerobaculia bacterium]